MIVRVLMATAVAAVVAAGAFASPVGKWKGKVNVNPKLPANLTAEQKKQVDAQLAMIKKMTIEMDVKRDKTYTVKTVGGPQAPKPETGKWSATGNKVKFTSPRNAQGQEMVLSADKKTMTATIPSQQGQPPVKIVFTRA